MGLGRGGLRGINMKSRNIDLKDTCKFSLKHRSDFNVLMNKKFGDLFMETLLV